MACEVLLTASMALLPFAQHHDYLWFLKTDLLNHDEVHIHTNWYLVLVRSNLLFRAREENKFYQACALLLITVEVTYSILGCNRIIVRKIVESINGNVVHKGQNSVTKFLF